jgi:hypothetical protein
MIPSKKSPVSFFFIVFVLCLVTGSFTVKASPPPPPAGGHGSGGNQQGAPIDGGMTLLFVLGTAYGTLKYKERTRKRNK